MRQQSEHTVPLLRAAGRADRDVVHGLLTAAGLMLDGVADHLEKGYAIALAEGSVVGVAGVECYDADGLLRSVAVAASHRGSGIGAALTRDRIDWARRNGLRTLWLLTEDAAEFFQRQGFEPVDRSGVPAGIADSQQYAVGCPASSVLMRMELQASS